MEANSYRHISRGLGKTENFVQPEAKWCYGYSKADCKHMAKLFCGKRVG